MTTARGTRLDGARGVARLGARGALPAAPHLQPAVHAAALAVRQRRLQPGLQGAGPRADRLHPDDARERGIADGDVVRVFNDVAPAWPAPCSNPTCGARSCSFSTGAWWDPVLAGDPPRSTARQPQHPHARHGHLAPRAGPSAQTTPSSSSAGTARAAGRGVCAARADRPSRVKVELAYGSEGLTVDLPDDRTTVVEPLHPTRPRRPRAVLARCAGP